MLMHDSANILKVILLYKEPRDSVSLSAILILFSEEVEATSTCCHQSHRKLSELSIVYAHVVGINPLVE